MPLFVLHITVRTVLDTNNVTRYNEIALAMRRSFKHTRSTMSDEVLHIDSGGDNAQDIMVEAFENDQIPVHDAYGSRYEFECTTTPHNGESTFGVVVYCYGRGDTLNWSGATSVGPASKIKDVRRAARKAWSDYE